MLHSDPECSSEPSQRNRGEWLVHTSSISWNLRRILCKTSQPIFNLKMIFSWKFKKQNKTKQKTSQDPSCLCLAFGSLNLRLHVLTHPPGEQNHWNPPCRTSSMVTAHPQCLWDSPRRGGSFSRPMTNHSSFLRMCYKCSQSRCAAQWVLFGSVSPHMLSSR